MIHRNAPIILGCGVVYPVYKPRMRVITPARDTASESLVNAAASERKRAFIVTVIINMNKKNVLNGAQNLVIKARKCEHTHKYC